MTLETGLVLLGAVAGLLGVFLLVQRVLEARRRRSEVFRGLTDEAD